jgi:hypothetical protein
MKNLSPKAAALALRCALAALTPLAACARQTAMKISISVARTRTRAWPSTPSPRKSRSAPAAATRSSLLLRRLGGEREMIEAVQLGTQELTFTSTGPVPNFVPEVAILDIPFLFRDYDHARKRCWTARSARTC